MMNETKTPCYLPNKVKISRDLFLCAISLLESLDIDDLPPETVQLYGYVLHAFDNKKSGFGLRYAYSKFVFDEDTQSRFEHNNDCDFRSLDDDLPF
jgi:hypothetical protein